jgi:hypothetical protein
MSATQTIPFAVPAADTTGVAPRNVNVLPECELEALEMLPLEIVNCRSESPTTIA